MGHDSTLTPVLTPVSHRELSENFVSVQMWVLLAGGLLAISDYATDRPTDRPWALVTGASSGIGAALAREAASAGYDVILVARRFPQLVTLAAELEATHGTRTRIVPADLSSVVGVDAVRSAADFEKLDLLILNAGVCPIPAAMCQQSAPELQRMLALNVGANVALLQRVGASFAARGHGRVLLVASSAGAAPGVPGVACYAASKAFLRSLAAGTGAELRRSGVSVTCGMPGAVDSEFASKSGLDKSAVFSLPGVRSVGGVVLSAERAARIMLSATLRGQREVVPGVLPRMYVGLSDRRIIPASLSRAIAAFSFGAAPSKAVRGPKPPRLALGSGHGGRERGLRGRGEDWSAVWE